MAINTYAKGTSAKLSNNFNSAEFACKGSGCCKTLKIDSKLITYLQKIRDHFAQPVIITSAYRCSAHNKRVGGASGSYHTKGQAADFYVKNVAPAKVAQYAESIGVKGIGLYEGADGEFIHIDTRTQKSFWYGHKQENRATFGGVPKVKISVLEFQKAAIADGYRFPKYGADGKWGSECESVARKAVCQRCYWPWKNKNLTKLIQKCVGVEQDGKFGAGTKAAVIAYQKAQGLPTNGVVDIDTWKKFLGI